MKQYSCIAVILPPHDTGKTYESLLNYSNDQNFFLNMLDVVNDIFEETAPPLILLCDISRELKGIKHKDPDALRRTAEGTIKAIANIKKAIELSGYSLLVINSNKDRLQADIDLASLLKKSISNIDIALFNVKDPNKVFNENKDILAYAVGEGSMQTHLKNIIKLQPVGPLYGVKDLLGDN